MVTHELERFLTTLGTIAAAAPLLGLLGTVVGMIEIFGSQTAGGTQSDPARARHLDRALQHRDGHHRGDPGADLLSPFPRARSTRWSSRWSSRRSSSWISRTGSGRCERGGDSEMNLRRNFHRDEPEINFIPLIDVLLVILIFLMVTTTYQRVAELSITLPEADADQAKQRPREINVGIDAQGRYVIDRTVFNFTTVGAFADMLRKSAGRREGSGGDHQRRRERDAPVGDPRDGSRARGGPDHITFATQTPTGASAHPRRSEAAGAMPVPIAGGVPRQASRGVVCAAADARSHVALVPLSFLFGCTVARAARVVSPRRAARDAHRRAGRRRRQHHRRRLRQDAARHRARAGARARAAASPASSAAATAAQDAPCA